MKRNQIQHIFSRNAPAAEGTPVSQRINQFYAQAIEQRLTQSELSAQQKIQLIASIIEHIKQPSL